MERTMARIAREAGATVRENVLVRDLNVQTFPGDERRIEVLAQGLPCRGGTQLAIDVTLRSPLSVDGQPRLQSAVQDGSVAEAAREDKEAQYPELLVSRRCHLAVVALETGGRWSSEAISLLEEIAGAKAREAPPALRVSSALSWLRRWSRLLATSTAVSFARSLVSSKTSVGDVQLGRAPALHDLLASGADGGSRCPFTRPVAPRQPVLEFSSCSLHTGVSSVPSDVLVCDQLQCSLEGEPASRRDQLQRSHLSLREGQTVTACVAGDAQGEPASQ
eukprot:12425467-Karenia_brevis.AAC.1